MIYYLIYIFNWLQYHSICWAIEDVRAAEWALGQLVPYHHMTRDENYIMDDMARRALEV